MITVIFGPPGAGKGCLQTAMIEWLYNNEGEDILSDCNELLEQYNVEFNRSLVKPKKVPIFSDFEVKFKIDYEKYYSPYFINGYFFGLNNPLLIPMFFPPCSKFFLTECQRYYDSRKSASLPDFVSRAYEFHRHYYIDITLDIQRLSLLDKNIKELATRFIYVKELKTIEDELGNIVKTIWFCKEFTNSCDAEDYAENNAKVGKDIKFEYDGNIFENYDSFSNFQKFIPDKYHDFKYIEHTDKTVYNEILMPEDYRGAKIRRN